MRNKIDYQKEYGRDYYESFLGSQNAEKDANFSYFLRSILEKKENIKSVLDIGCGKGGFLAACYQSGISDLYGVDISQYALGVAKKLKGAKLYKVNLEKDPLPFGNNQFDCVAAIDIVEHVKNSAKLLGESFRVLKKGGIFFITTENTGSLFSLFFSRFFEEHSGHINLQPAANWEKDLTRYGFSEIKMRGIMLHGFPPLLDFRNFLRKFKIPTIAHPVVFPVRTLTGTLVISATKR